MSASVAQKRRHEAPARTHLAWCREHGIDVVDGQWTLENPISGLLLAAVLQRSSAAPLLNILCGQSWNQIQVTSAWWPSSVVDLMVGFVADGSAHMLILENKHLDSNSNQPGHQKLTRLGRMDEVLWQTEKMLCDIDDARVAGDTRLLGGPFDPAATIHPVLLDASERTMDEAFPMYDWMVPAHRHDHWATVSYSELAEGLRAHYEHDPIPMLEPLLSQIFAFAKG
ncbi:hypothetical protein [Brachybacterium tyrofermentans]|uniref:hypothetical protein n=1 Tax=Brachybacterium tyrofermentans TaxID=47848 RepID=UPI001867D282|nr:hypothetical protein [Brachybacterium tyrofermentans]